MIDDKLCKLLYTHVALTALSELSTHLMKDTVDVRPANRSEKKWLITCLEMTCKNSVELSKESKKLLDFYLMLSSSTNNTTPLALCFELSRSTILSKSSVFAFLRIFSLTATQIPYSVDSEIKLAMPCQNEQQIIERQTIESQD